MLVDKTEISNNVIFTAREYLRFTNRIQLLSDYEYHISHVYLIVLIVVIVFIERKKQVEEHLNKECPRYSYYNRKHVMSL